MITAVNSSRDKGIKKGVGTMSYRLNTIMY